MIAAERVSVEDRYRIEDLYAEYVAALDERRYDDWLALFIEDCSYRIVPRENFDRNLPLSTLAFESKGMLRDRIYGVTETLFHEAYYQRHLVTNFRVTAAQPGFAVAASYLVIRTKADALSELYSAGHYLDRIVYEGGDLRFAAKMAVFDSELIPNSLIYPL